MHGGLCMRLQSTSSSGSAGILEPVLSRCMRCTGGCTLTSTGELRCRCNSPTSPCYILNLVNGHSQVYWDRTELMLEAMDAASAAEGIQLDWGSISPL